MPTSIADRYRSRYISEVDAAEKLAHDLMAGDPATFKRGYSPCAALSATCAAFRLSYDNVIELSGRLGLED